MVMLYSKGHTEPPATGKVEAYLFPAFSFMLFQRINKSLAAPTHTLLCSSRVLQWRVS